MKFVVTKPGQPEAPSPNFVTSMRFGDWGIGYRVHEGPGKPTLFFHVEERIVAFDPGLSFITHCSSDKASSYYHVTEILPKGTNISITI